MLQNGKVLYVARTKDEKTFPKFDFQKLAAQNVANMAQGWLGRKHSKLRCNEKLAYLLSSHFSVTDTYSSVRKQPKHTAEANTPVV